MTMHVSLKKTGPSENPLKIPLICEDGTINIIADTLRKNKQALVFNNTKRSAEKTAEDIGRKLKKSSAELTNLSEDVLKAVSSPTKQCRRLSNCVKNGVAFHHAGLVSKQRELIENAFRKGSIRVISCTPTLAAGLDLPAFRTILKDLRRYGKTGLKYIPVLEYLQMSGRAGRPKYDSYGESICIAPNEIEKKKLFDTFIMGEPEQIYSKLAVEPVLRTYLLSLLATKFLHTRKEIMDFFEKTFWAHQFKDMVSLELIIEKMLDLLEDWEFIKSSKKESDFISASEIEEESYNVTILGKRIAELYLDPLTAHHIIKCLRKATASYILPFSFFQMVSHTIEMRPLIRAKNSDWENLQDFLEKNEELILEQEPSLYDLEYGDFINSVKTALFFQDWIEEKNEEYLLETYNTRPGEIRAKLDTAEWLLYSSSEILKIMQFRELTSEINKLRIRLKHGAKEELLPLLKLKDIGRVRARKMFRSNIRNIKAVRSVSIVSLSQILGKKMALNIKTQVGQEFHEEKIQVKKNKRKGQVSLADY